MRLRIPAAAQELPQPGVLRRRERVLEEGGDEIWGTSIGRGIDWLKWFGGGGELAEGRTEGRKGNDDDASKEGEEDETRARARRGRSEPVHIKVDKAWAPSFLQATEL